MRWGDWGIEIAIPDEEGSLIQYPLLFLAVRSFSGNVARTVARPARSRGLDSDQIVDSKRGQRKRV